MYNALAIKKTYFIFFSLIIFDQLIKYIIRTYGGFYICNENIAFGIKVPDAIFWIFWLAIILFLLYSLYKKCFLHNTFYILLILAGAISNILDRLYFSCIIDFIDLKFWPVFNLADVYITIGSIVLLFYLFKNTKTNLNF